MQTAQHVAPRCEHCQCSRRRSGFTIVELLVVMAVLAALTAIALPAITRARTAARKLECLNHLRNLALGLTQFDLTQKRLPPSGMYGHNALLNSYPLYTWEVAVLPHIEQQTLVNQLDLTLPTDDPDNVEYTTAYVPAFVCPADISRSDEKAGDLSYAVNGGIGFTVKYHNGVRDCPVDSHWRRLDLDGDGSACADVPGDDIDRDYFKKLGLFFLETENKISDRHHSIDDIHDGTTQTFLVTENVRTGTVPGSLKDHFANPDPYHSAVYVGHPCGGLPCTATNVNYALCNADRDRINSGLWSAEGSSPVPNSFHDGGVNMAYADAHIAFLAESIDGGVYAALASPQGLLLADTPLAQTVATGAGE